MGGGGGDGGGSGGGGGRWRWEVAVAVVVWRCMLAVGGLAFGWGTHESGAVQQ